MTHRLLALVAAMFAVAHAAHAYGPDLHLENWDRPVQIGFSSSLDGHCAAAEGWSSRARPIVEADKRLLLAGFRGMLQLDLDCVLHAYGPVLLAKYAEEGDPVANYALALQSAKRGDLCDRREEIIRELTVAGEAARGGCSAVVDLHGGDACRTRPS